MLRLAERIDYVGRDDDGITLLVSSDPQAGDLVFDPPARVFPSDLEEGAAWSSEGSLGDSLSI